MITCSQCGRENEVFFKFCLGCGAELVSSGEPKTAKVAPRDRTARIASDTLVSKAVRTEAKPTVSVSEPAAPAKSDAVVSKPASKRSAAPAGAPKPVEAAEIKAVFVSAVSASPVTEKPKASVETAAVVRPEPVPDSSTVSPITTAASPGPEESGQPDRGVSSVSFGPATATTAPIVSDESIHADVSVNTNREVAVVPAAESRASSATTKVPEVSASLTSVPSSKVQQPTATVPQKDHRDSSVTPAEGLSGEPRVCVACNAVVSAGHAFCANCGTRYETKDRRNIQGRVEVRGESTQPTKATLVLIRPDQSDGDSFPLYRGVNSLGRSGTDIAFPHDDFLARHHLDILVEDGSLSVIPKRTLNGTFFRIRDDVVLASGNEIRVGQELLRVDLYQADSDSVIGGQGEKTIGGPVPAGTWGRLCVLAGKDRVANAFLLAAPEVYLGRDQGHVTFPHDGYVSGKHAKLTCKDGVAKLSDTGSRNGTYVRITAEHDLKSGDLLLAGQQLFRIQLQ